VEHWQFLKLEEQTVSIDLFDYSLPPAEQILGFPLDGAGGVAISLLASLFNQIK